MESVQIITGPIRGVQRRGGAQQAWGCGWGDRFGVFGLLFFFGYIPCTFSHTVTACTCAENPRRGTRCVRFRLDRLIGKPGQPPLRSSPLGSAQRNAQRDGHTHRDPLLLLTPQRAASAAPLLRRVGCQTRLAVRVDFDPAIIIRSLSQSLI